MQNIYSVTLYNHVNPENIRNFRMQNIHLLTFCGQQTFINTAVTTYITVYCKLKNKYTTKVTLHFAYITV